jgi:Tfp pilus assembly protein PilE
MFSRLLLRTLAFAVAAGPLTGQAPTAPATPAGPSPLVTLRATLRNLVTHQEKYYAQNARYASTLDALTPLGFAVPSKVTVTFIETKPNAYSASAAHADVAGANCVNWVGAPGEVKPPATALDHRNGREGEPSCDAAVAVVENQQIAEMSSALRNLVVAEEKYWADHGTYTTDASALGFYPAPKGTRPPFLPQVIFAGSRGWSGIVVHRALRKSCVIYAGSPDELPFIPRTERDRLPASGEGVPTCERP